MIAQQDLSSALMKHAKLDMYSQWIYSHFEKYVHGSVLEVGAGIGNIVNHYVDKCELVVATEIFDSKVIALRERFHTKAVQAYNIDIFEQDYEQNFHNDTFDVIICINVLEHIRDDVQALEVMSKLLKPNGVLVLYVPAIAMLFGEIDRFVGHHRRYTRGELTNKVESLSLKVLDQKYANFAGIIPYYIKGKVFKKRSSYSETISDNNVGFYNLMFRMMQKVEKTFSPPIGLSEIVIARKV